MASTPAAPPAQPPVQQPWLPPTLNLPLLQGRLPPSPEPRPLQSSPEPMQTPRPGSRVPTPLCMAPGGLASWDSGLASPLQREVQIDEAERTPEGQTVTATAERQGTWGPLSTFAGGQLLSVRFSIFNLSVLYEPSVTNTTFNYKIQKCVSRG